MLYQLKNLIEKKWLILFGTGVAGVTIGLDLTIVNASLPNIQEELNANMNQLQWIMSGFGLIFCAFLVVMGRFGDLYGRKLFLLSSLIAFSIASLGAGLAASPGQLIIMRMLQGLFGAAILPCGTAITASTFPKDEQGRALGIYGSLVGVGIGFGPLIGTVLDNMLNWRWIFFINLPIIAISLLICAPILKESKSTQPLSIDWIGAVLLALTLGSFTFAISESQFYGWSSWAIIGSFVLSICSAILLIYFEKRAATPVIPPSLFSNKGFILATLIYAGAVAFHWPVLFLMPIYLNHIVGYSAMTSGLLLASMTLMTIISPMIAGYFYDKRSKAITIHLIFLLNVISLLLFMVLDVNGSAWLIVSSFILYGLAWGIGNGIATPVALSTFNDANDSGLVSGALTTILNICAVCSLAIVISIFQNTEQTVFKEKIINKVAPEIVATLQKTQDQATNQFSESVNKTISNTYKESFIYAMNFVYFLIACATSLCWFIANRLIKTIINKKNNLDQISDNHCRLSQPESQGKMIVFKTLASPST